MKGLLVILAPLTALVMALPAPAFAQSGRIASDFEIQQMTKQAADSHDFLGQFQARLNLGDLYRTRTELAQARVEYRQAASLAKSQRTATRKSGDVSLYAQATMYAGLAHAKLGDEHQAFELLEEAARYDSSQARLWNVYSIAMTQLNEPGKAVAAGRNAIAIAEATLTREPTVAHRLDAALYHYSLALALVDTREQGDAIRELEQVLAALQSKELDAVRREIAKRESFEIYSTTSSDADTYVSLYNRAHLQLANLYETRGNLRRTRELYEAVLALRTDDATALAGLARLTSATSGQDRRYAEAFDANPFSLPLVREYQKWLKGATPKEIDDSSTGGRVRKALAQMERGESRAARETLQALVAQHPHNQTLTTLLAESQLAAGGTTLPGASPTADELRRVIALFAQDTLTPDQRVQLDTATYASTAFFDDALPGANAGQTIFETGEIDGVPFKFSEPTAFAGTFAPGAPLRLTYRILGATELAGADALLLEPVKLEVGK